MRRINLLSIACLSFITSFAQPGIDALKDSIVAEGQRLYRSEMASWYGTDILLEKLKDKQQDIGGYFSYASGDSTRFVFFNKDTHPSVLGTVSFDSTYKVENAGIDVMPRNFTTYENSLYTMRKAALDQMNSDTLFKRYNNTNFNLIPLINGAEKKVYVLTGPQKGGVIIFGNDYLLTFDKDDKLIVERRLHKNILAVEYGHSGKTEVGGVHSHLPETGDLITPTDICTLMLYEKYAKWEQYMVVSEKYISIWNCNTNTLVALTREAWDKIHKDQGNRN